MYLLKIRNIGATETVFGETAFGETSSSYHTTDTLYSVSFSTGTISRPDSLVLFATKIENSDIARRIRLALHAPKYIKKVR